jgi:23S rRNA pseudouridine1911/1915/1917 synthase
MSAFDSPGIPGIIEETGDFAVVYKPPRMHCAPLRPHEGGTLLDWYAAIFPPVLDLAGKKAGEGGLVHRLDFETRGLVLFGKTQAALDFLLARQDEGVFIKEYSACCVKAGVTSRLPGFPPPPAISGSPPFIIESFFRPYGPGRKQVRPVQALPVLPQALPARTQTLSVEGKRGSRDRATDKGACYKTEVISIAGTGPEFFAEKRESAGREYAFTVRIRRGFRHQIRCHLAWAGFPILNDPLYGPAAAESASGFLALCSHALFFPDPRTGEDRAYRCY